MTRHAVYVYSALEWIRFELYLRFPFYSICSGCAVETFSECVRFIVADGNAGAASARDTWRCIKRSRSFWWNGMEFDLKCMVFVQRLNHKQFRCRNTVKLFSIFRINFVEFLFALRSPQAGYKTHVRGRWKNGAGKMEWREMVGLCGFGGIPLIVCVHTLVRKTNK